MHKNVRYTTLDIYLAKNGILKNPILSIGARPSVNVYEKVATVFPSDCSYPFLQQVK
jgi:hypothetical protein